MSGPDDKPLLVLDRVGKGRVAEILSDQGWLWARGFEGGGPQTELLRRLAHWLMKEPELEDERLSMSIANGKLAVDQIRAAQVDVVVLDIEMPVMDGLTALPLLLRADPGVRVIMAEATRSVKLPPCSSTESSRSC